MSMSNFDGGTEGVLNGIPVMGITTNTMGISPSKLRRLETFTEDEDEDDITSLGLTYYSYQLYDVNFYGDTVKTLVTKTPCIIDTWISDTESLHEHRLHKLVVGLDIEWRPNISSVQNPPATLQLCVGRNCLIIQLQFLPKPFPQSLISFLNNDNYTFVGVGINDDAYKLYDFFNVQVSRTADLRGLAGDALDERRLRSAGLKTLAKEVLGKEIDKPKYVSLSHWDDDWLSFEQIQYACVDAYVSFQIGRRLKG